jgi:hypothetical protein
MIKHSICIALAISFAIPASAERPWPYSEFSAERKAPKAKRTYRKRHRVITRRRHKRPEPRVSSRNCQPTISVVGDQAQSTKGAQSQSWKSWQQEARYRYGERFADPRHAELLRMFQHQERGQPGNRGNRAKHSIRTLQRDSAAMQSRSRVMQFDGETFDENRDGARLSGQAKAVYDLMRDGRWRTLRRIADVVEGSEAGGGLWQYRVLPPLPSDQSELFEAAE